jgi:hypothetical protein
MELVCSRDRRSHPSANKSRSWASRPAIWSAVEVRAYPISIVPFPITDISEFVILFYQNVKFNLCDSVLSVVGDLSYGLGLLEEWVSIAEDQRKEAITGRDHGEETLAEIGRCCNVSGWTIARFR